MSADLIGQNLGAVERFERGRNGRSANEFAFLGQEEELIAGESESGCAEIFFLPANFAGFEIDTSKARRRFKARIGATMNAEEKTIEINAGCVVIRKNVITRPKFFGT